MYVVARDEGMDAALTWQLTNARSYIPMLCITDFDMPMCEFSSTPFTTYSKTVHEGHWPKTARETPIYPSLSTATSTEKNMQTYSVRKKLLSSWLAGSSNG